MDMKRKNYKLIEYSDDEEEAQAKAKRKQERKANKQTNQEQDTQSQVSPNKPNAGRRTWQGRGRGRAIQHPRLPPPGATHPTPISQSSVLLPGQPGQFVPPFIPPGQYMPPPLPPSFNIPPPPLPAMHHGQGVLPPHLPPPPVHHGQGIPPPIGQGTAMHHGPPRPPPHPPMNPGPGLLPTPTSGLDFRNTPPPMMPLGPGARPALHPGLLNTPPPGSGGPRHAMPGRPPRWPSLFPPPRQ